jgi:TonB family protein
MKALLRMTGRTRPESRALYMKAHVSKLILLLLLCSPLAAASAQSRQTSLAVLDFGSTETGKRAADTLWKNIKSEGAFALTDREEAQAAARGQGYQGSLNMTLEEARELGAVTGADFFITGDAETLRRSPSEGEPYYESYASIFLVSSRTGRLISWERPTFKAATPAASLEQLLKALAEPYVRGRYRVAVTRALEDEMRMRAQAVGRSAPLIEEAPDDLKSASAAGLKLPVPYRRLRPAYPETAAVAEAVATVDVEVDIDAEGEVARVEVVRWAGFGLDEATVTTVKQMHFRPALRDGQPFPMRVLLRYNFRKPPVENK